MSPFSSLSRVLELLPSAKQKSRRRGPAADRWSKRLRFETLERREVMATVPVVFSVPPDVAPRGVEVSMFATLTNDYTNAANTFIPADTVVYYDPNIPVYNDPHDPTKITGHVADYAAASTTSDLTFPLTITGGQVTINYPDVDVTAGQIVIGVGGAPVVQYNPAGPGNVPPANIATPTPATEPYGYFGLFEYSVVGGDWNIDVSMVDQIGFPFTVTATPTPSAPDQNGVGVPQYRGDLLNLYSAYIASLGSEAAGFQAGYLQGDGYRVVAPQHTLDTPVPVVSAPVPTSGGKLAKNTMYYYWVTAGNDSGETGASTFQNGQTANNRRSLSFSWNAIPGATAYNIYRSTDQHQSNSQLIGTVRGSSAATYTYRDKSLAIKSNTRPPANSYSFNPMNHYFNDKLDHFFSHYETHQFSITANFYSNVYSTFTGNTNTQYQINGTGPYYTVLNLSSTDPTYSGMEFLIFKPYFAENTTGLNGQVAPSWIQDNAKSPAWMIFGCGGVFASAQPGVDSTALGGLQNRIAAAFNRGIATNFNIVPDAWANFPGIIKAERAVTHSPALGLNSDTYYYYVITAVSNGNESTASGELAAKTSSTETSITVSWNAQNAYDATNFPLGADSYNIYRSTQPGTGYQLIANVLNTTPNLPISYIDSSLTTQNISPQLYYAPGTTSNWYAAFTHLNYTTNPISGVSINGLNYGFAYDDQGNDSSDFTADSPTQISINLLPWTTRSSVPDNPTNNPLPAPPTSPTSLTILQQAKCLKVKQSTTLIFKVYTAQGQPYYGGTNVLVTLTGPKKNKIFFAVKTDPLDGEGRLPFHLNQIGKYSITYTLANGTVINGPTINVTAKSVKQGK